MEVWGLTAIRRFVLSGALALSVLAGVLALSSSASAEVTHPFLSSITEANGKPLKTPWGMAFDASGNLLLAEPQGQVVDLFDSSNAFTGQ
ncbi:MAG: hypothetical protein ACHQHO_11985, partial [Solirubrobacterales bacterium]